MLTSTGAGIDREDASSINDSDRDRYKTNGYLYPSNIGDDVGIGVSTPAAKVDIQGGYFLFNEDAQSVDFPMHASLLDASDDKIYVGDEFGDHENGNTVGDVTVDYVAKFDNESSTGLRLAFAPSNTS